jgi:hypothetical protein
MRHRGNLAQRQIDPDRERNQREEMRGHSGVFMVRFVITCRGSIPAVDLR